MHDVEQGLPRRLRDDGGSRRYILLNWKILTPIVALLFVFALLPIKTSTRTPAATLTYTQLVQTMNAGRVASIAIEPGYGIHGIWAAGAHAAADFVVLYTARDFAPVLTRAERANVSVSFRREGESEAYKRWIVVGGEVTLVVGLLLLLFWSVRHQLGHGAGSVGKEAGRGTTTFEDVAGTQGAAEELREIVEFLRSPDAFSALGARVPKGVLLVGPPGTGKTLLARAVAGEAGVPFFFLSGSEVTGFVVGLGAHRLRSLFKKARKKGGVIFIDELDALGGARGKNRSHNEDDRSLNQLLVEMDGFSQSHGVVVIGATNRPEDRRRRAGRNGRDEAGQDRGRRDGWWPRRG